MIKLILIFVKEPVIYQLEVFNWHLFQQTDSDLRSWSLCTDIKLASLLQLALVWTGTAGYNNARPLWGKDKSPLNSYKETSVPSILPRNKFDPSTDK